MRKILGIATLAALVTSVACSKPAQPGDELSRALDQAKAAPLTLAPQAGRTQVVSSIERAPSATPALRPSERKPVVTQQRQPQIASAPVVAIEPTPAPQPPVTAVADVPAPQSSRPSARPVPQQAAPRGGWKTEGEVIRNAPFPIQP